MHLKKVFQVLKHVKLADTFNNRIKMSRNPVDTVKPANCHNTYSF